jgi:hypothetical protein
MNIQIVKDYCLFLRFQNANAMRSPEIIMNEDEFLFARSHNKPPFVGVSLIAILISIEVNQYLCYRDG